MGEKVGSQQSNVRELAEIVENTMADFNDAMRKREEMSIRIGRRTTQVVRVGAVTVALLSVAVIFLTVALKEDMARMSKQMQQMTGYMQEMNTSISAMPEMSASVQEMNLLMQDMSVSIKAVPVISTSVQRMSTDMTAMNNQVHYLNQNIGSMRHNVDRMASPMKVFPFP